MGEMKKGAYTDVATSRMAPFFISPNRVASKALPWRGSKGQRPSWGLGRSPGASSSPTSMLRAAAECHRVGVSTAAR